MSTILTDLPADVFPVILNFLDHKNICRASKVCTFFLVTKYSDYLQICKAFNEGADDSLLWKVRHRCYFIY